jgi:hypothetical protein
MAVLWASGEMADTLASGASARKSVEVQVLSRPPVIIQEPNGLFF